jgi:hypothetical protein
MKRLVWIDANGVRAFGCAGCRWTYRVKEFTPGSSETELSEDFRGHDCDNPRFKFENDRSSTLPGTDDLISPSVNGDQLMRDLCGLTGTVLAEIEALSASAPSNGDLAAIKAELDSVRSLLWLHKQASPAAAKDGPQIASTTDQKRRWRRYDFQVPVTLTTRNGNEKIPARGSNLNEGGLTAYAEAELTLGDELKAEFRPPFSSTALNLPVVVKNRIGNRYGMEFMGTNSAELQEIVLLRRIVKMLETRVSYYEERATKKVVD